MSHVCRRALSEKEKVLNVFDNPSKTTNENSCSVNRSAADCRCLNHHSCSKTDGQPKKKLLRKRKERSQMRGSGKDTKPHHHYCRQSSKDMKHLRNCCHSSCRCPSRSNASFLNVVPVAQEPSIITESRLIGHHGLFNREVKSIDIERLLTKQRKLEKDRKINTASNNCLASHIPSPLCSSDLFGGHTDEVEKKVDQTAKVHHDFQEKEKKIVQSESQGSDLTPGQKSQQQLNPSSGSYKSSVDVEIAKSITADSITSEKGRVLELSPVCETENVKTLKKKEKGQTFTTLEHTPKNQEPPVHKTQARGLSPSPLQLSSSPTAGITRFRRKDHDCVSESISAAAARLSRSLQFPRLGKRNLLSESREVLLKALQEHHGPRLQENLLKVQQCLNFDAVRAVQNQHQNQRPVLIDEDGLWSAGRLCGNTVVVL